MNLITDNMSEKSLEKSAISEATNTHVLDEPTSSTLIPEVKWSAENEKIPSEWCDIAKCYKWLHNRAHQKYSVLHAWFTIPAIIFSTISGTASFAQNSLPASMQKNAPMVIGSVNIIIGILTTIQQYMKISELNEAYRVSGIAWDKFARNISIELSKAPEERIMDAGHFLKTYREEFDRLMETSPSIPQSVINEFIETFSGRKTKHCCMKQPKDEDEKREEKELRKAKFKELKKPDECSSMMISETGKHDWYNPDRIQEPQISIGAIEDILSQKIRSIHETIKQTEEDRRLEEKSKAEIEDQKRKIQDKLRNAVLVTKKQKEKIESQIKLFNDAFGRDPLIDELKEILDTEELDENIKADYIKKYKANIV